MPLRECAAATLHCLLLQAGEIYLLRGLCCSFCLEDFSRLFIWPVPTGFSEFNLKSPAWRFHSLILSLILNKSLCPPPPPSSHLFLSSVLSLHLPVCLVHLSVWSLPAATPRGWSLMGRTRAEVFVLSGQIVIGPTVRFAWSWAGCGLGHFWGRGQLGAGFCLASLSPLPSCGLALIQASPLPAGGEPQPVLLSLLQASPPPTGRVPYGCQGHLSCSRVCFKSFRGSSSAATTES